MGGMGAAEGFELAIGVGSLAFGAQAGDFAEPGLRVGVEVGRRDSSSRCERGRHRCCRFADNASFLPLGLYFVGPCFVG